jgi:hypothetical protein
MKRNVKTLEEISASTTRYYDTLTEEERAENLAWGRFAETQLAEDDFGVKDASD